MQDKLVTVFGGSGFLGRYVVQALLKSGARVRIAARDPREAWHLKSQGGLGQTQFVAADIRKPESVSRAIAGSDAAVNLVGILKGDFQALHVDGARNIAQAATASGVSALAHVSAIGADPASTSAYGRSKGEGEAAMRAAFPATTILRPSIVFGREDGFVNRFAGLIAMLPVVPIIRGAAKFQPVYVGDVAKAIVAALADPGAHGGQTYELGGPEVITMGDLNRWIARETGRRRAFVEMPDAIAGAMASGLGWMPGAPMTRDQWLMLQSDNVVAPDARGLSAFGIVATPLEAVAEGWLVRYRRQGRFADKTQ
ncbi:MAG: complex I NDUFA9 subunit family protein [Sphingomonadaceae bacterium]